MNDIKERLDLLTKSASENGNLSLLEKLSEIKGLYLAYTTVNSIELLEKVVDSLIDSIDILLEKDTNNTKKAINNRYNKEGELAEFYKFLISQGKKATTADVYRKAINQVIKAKDLNGVEELINCLPEVYDWYRENDKAYHNLHAAALKQFSIYIGLENN